MPKSDLRDFPFFEGKNSFIDGTRYNPISLNIYDKVFVQNFTTIFQKFTDNILYMLLFCGMASKLTSSAIRLQGREFWGPGSLL